MKNIHVLPTDKYKSSRLVRNGKELLLVGIPKNYTFFGITVSANIYITSEEEIKEGYYLDLTHNIIMKSVFYSSSDKNCQKIILTTDQDLINDGVQAIPDDFLEWFVKNPSCEYVDLIGLRKEKGYEFLEYEIIIPKEEPKTVFDQLEVGKDYKQEVFELGEESKQETLEEAFEQSWLKSPFGKYSEPKIVGKELFEKGVKWQQERSYSEEEVYELMDKREVFWVRYKNTYAQNYISLREWFEQYKKK